MVAEDGDRRNLLLIAFVVVLVAAGLIFALLLSETHGQNISGAAFASSSDIPIGYSPPWNIFADNAQFLTVSVGDATDSAVPITVDASQTGMIFYKYYYISENGEWQRYTFPQPTISSSSWIADEASATADIDLSTLGEGSDNYVVTYACTKENGAWKCGCSAPTVCNQWSIQDFTKPTSTEPPLPGCPPDPLCSGKAEGDTFCVASRPSQVYTCAEDADGCLVASSESCASGETCTFVEGVASCITEPLPSTCLSADDCEDNDPCTTDTCSAGACLHTVKADGASCTLPPSQDGTGDGICQEGVCVPVQTSGCDAPKCYDGIAQVCVDELGVRALDIMAEGQVCVNGEWGPHVPLQ